MNYTKSLAKACVCLLTLALVVHLTNGQDARQSKPKDQEENRGQLQSSKQKNNETCGTSDDLAARIELCAKPLMDILQGTMNPWPRSEKDIQDLCTSFTMTERCIRDAGRRCAKGLQKTIVSTLATSIARTRKRECSAQKFGPLLKSTFCIEKNQGPVQSRMTYIRAQIRVIEIDMVDFDKKTTSICCLVRQIEDDLREIMAPRCSAADAQTVINLYRSVLEDVIDIVCRSPKCVDIYKGYKINAKTGDFRGIIEAMLRVVFSLG